MSKEEAEGRAIKNKTNGMTSFYTANTLLSRAALRAAFLSLVPVHVARCQVPLPRVPVRVPAAIAYGQEPVRTGESRVAGDRVENTCLTTCSNETHIEKGWAFALGWRVYIGMCANIFAYLQLKKFHVGTGTFTVTKNQTKAFKSRVCPCETYNFVSIL